MTRRPYRGAPQPAWMASVRVGDVVQEASGSYRVVRDVHRYCCGALGSLTFTIRRPSWTRRATTTLNYVDLRMRGFHPVGARLKLDSVMDLMVDAAIVQMHRPHRGERFILTAQDVRGIA